MAHAVVPKYVFVPLAEERQLEEEAEHVIDTTSIQLKSCESLVSQLHGQISAKKRSQVHPAVSPAGGHHRGTTIYGTIVLNFGRQ